MSNQILPYHAIHTTCIYIVKAVNINQGKEARTFKTKRGKGCESIHEVRYLI